MELALLDLVLLLTKIPLILGLEHVVLVKVMIPLLLDLKVLGVLPPLAGVTCTFLTFLTILGKSTRDLAAIGNGV
jgi:hypothetical protein